MQLKGSSLLFLRALAVGLRRAMLALPPSAVGANFRGACWVYNIIIVDSYLQPWMIFRICGLPLWSLDIRIAGAQDKILPVFALNPPIQKSHKGQW